MLLRSVRPAFTNEAVRAKIQGTVELEAIINSDGTVGEIRVVRSLDSVFGLDEEAIKAARQWKFKPAMRFGQPVAYRARLSVDFNIF